MGDSAGGDAVVLDGDVVGGVVATAVVEGSGVAAEADGATGLEGTSRTGAVGGSTLGSHPISAMAATETSAAEESPPRRLVSGRRLVPQKTQAASLERT